MEKVKYQIKIIAFIMILYKNLKIGLIFLGFILLIIPNIPIGDCSPLPVYGRIQSSVGVYIENAEVNISSEYGYKLVYSEKDGYWQTDVGDPVNWPVDTLLFINVSSIINNINWTGFKEILLTSDYLDTGTIILYSENGSIMDKNDSIDNDSFRNNTDSQSPVAVIINNGFFEQGVGSTVFFDGLDSYDPDGEIVGYRWDFNGDGVYETSWSDKGIYTHVFNTVGIYSVVMQVKDDDNLNDTVQSLVDISHDPVIVEIISPKTILTSHTIQFSFQTFSSFNITNISWLIDDTVLSYNASFKYGFVSSSPGYHYVTVYVLDDQGNIYHDVDQIYIILDTDKDFIPNEIEAIVGTSIFIGNQAMTLTINGNSHLLIDSDDDTIYDIFYNESRKNYSLIQTKDDMLLIDDDLDGYYEFSYAEGVLNSYDDPNEKSSNGSNSTPGFSLVIFLVCIILLAFYKKKRG